MRPAASRAARPDSAFCCREARFPASFRSGLAGGSWRGMKARTFSIVLFVIALLYTFSPGSSNVSHVAHLGGMVTGFVYLKRAWRVGALWSEIRDVSVSEGFYAVLLGAETPFPADLWARSALWLQLSLDGEPLTPRHAVGAVPAVQRYVIVD